MTLSVDFYKGIVVFFRQSQIRTIHLSVKTLQFQSVAMQSHIKGWKNVGIIWNNSKIIKWGYVPEVKFSIMNQIITIVNPHKVTIGWPLRMNIIPFPIRAVTYHAKIILIKCNTQNVIVTRFRINMQPRSPYIHI